MKSLVRPIISSVLLASSLIACSLGGQPQTADPDVVNTAIAGTQQTEALAQATVNSSVLTAMPATPTPGPTVEYVTLTEEELAALIDEAVNEAIAATENTSAAVTTTTSDGTVTADEVVYLYDYYYYADYYVQYAEALINEYYALYADLATQMINELATIEAELETMNQTLSSIDSSLQQINATLQQGAAATQEAIAQLESAAQTAQSNAQALQSQAQDMLSVLQADQQGRVDAIQNIQANNIPTDKISSLQAAFDFLDTIKVVTGDNKLTRDELMNIAQLGKNAQAGFTQFGGANGNRPGNGNGPLAGNNIDLAQFNGKFDEISTQFARGEIPHGKNNANSFETSLGDRPRR